MTSSSPEQPSTPSDAGKGRHRVRSRHVVPIAWTSGLIAAGLLSLGATGTLSSWTSAILNNNANTATAANAVVLQEQGTGSSTVNADCISSNGGFSNTSTCTEINKYGGATMQPGDTKTTDVTFTNIGSGPGASFALAPGSCTQTPTAGTGTPVNPANLCTNADLTVNVKCYDGASIGTGTAYMTYNGSPGAFTSTLTHTATIAPNASISCRFVVTLSASASPLDGGITVSQPLTWTLAS